MLWERDGEDSDPRRHGIPLRRFAPDPKPMWLVDGQQRTRAMLDTFEQLIGLPERSDRWSIVRRADLDALRAVGATLRCSSDDPEGDADAVGDLQLWVVVLPAMPAFDRAREPYFGRHSESRNVRRGSMFRRVRPRARTRLDADCKTRPVPPLPVGTIPLVTLLSPGGIFHEVSLRESALAALETFTTEDADLTALDGLLPWGPQFVTGQAYESSAQDHLPAVPMRWSHLHARRDERVVRELADRLRGLFAPEWESVFERFKGMLEGSRFALGWLPPGNVSVAIDAYVRINRAGIRVRTEERALALLSRAQHELLDDLADFTRQRDGGETIADQRALLVHESDRQVGFGVWMATLTRTPR